MAASDFYDKVQKFYIAFYQRPADPEGLIFWGKWFEQFDGNLDHVLNSFANSVESKGLYGEINSGNIESVINSIYKATFNRDAEPEGLSYWKGVFDAGHLTPINITYSILEGAQANDALTVANKLAAANKFTKAIDPELDGQNMLQSYAGTSAADAARDFLAKVTYDAGTVPSDAEIANHFVTQANSLASQAMGKSAVNSGIGQLLNASDANVRAVANQDNIKWDSKNINYSFNETKPVDHIGKDANGWTPMNSEERSVAREAIAKVASLIDVSFNETANNSGNIRFSGNYQETSSGYAYFPGTNLGGDIFISTKDRNVEGYYDKNHFGYTTIVHELGHAMGLKHPFEGGTTLASVKENMDHSIMSYTETKYVVPDFKISGSDLTVSYGNAAYQDEYMLYDVAALQAMYGANMSTKVGDTTYNIDTSKPDYTVIWDAGGADTIDASTSTGVCDINMKDGTLSSVNIKTIEEQKQETKGFYQSNNKWNAEIEAWVDSSYAKVADRLYTGENNLSITHGTIIENVKTGSGNDIVRDNSVNNRIETGTGDDTIYLGAGGYDQVYCGEGNDKVYVTGSVQQEEQSDGSIIIVGANYSAVVYGAESILQA